MNHYTRFRAYQLGTCGASFSLSVDDHFTLIEARYNDTNSPHILWEMRNLGIQRINTLHITSWDDDHCQAEELQRILNDLRPSRIECPAYMPHTENGKKSLNIIRIYLCDGLFPIGPKVVASQVKTRLQGRDIFYNPIQLGAKSNDNSVVKFFRTGSFQILSLGDCEDGSIRDRLMNDDILQNEVDILILAHHGADNGFTTPEFLQALSPKVAICASDYGNQYEHPDPAIVSRLANAHINYYSTKTGDIIAQSVDKYYFKVSNYIGNNEKKGKEGTYPNKTYYIND